MNPSPPAAAVPNAFACLLPIVAMVFSAMLCVGLPLPVLPVHLHETLGFGPFVVGLVIGLQSLAAVVTRPHAGALVDRRGPPLAVLTGAPLLALAGGAYLLSTLPDAAGAQLALLLAGRLLLGLGESLFLTGTMSWGIARLGAARTGMVMAWQGIAMFSALGLGAPAGLWLLERFGFAAVGWATLLLPLLAMALAALLPAPPARPRHDGPRVPMRRVLGLIARPGGALALASMPFAMLSGFITLHYAAEGWAGAGLALTAFAAGFILVRLFLAHLPDRLGGRSVGAVCCLVVMLGQGLLWLATAPWMALAGAAVTGLGSSLMFPAMGVEAIRRVPPESRGVAVGGFMASFDVSVGLTGPLAGLLIAASGYRAMFLAGVLVSLAALALILWRPRDEVPA
ncbi:arabinose transporter [Roseomonas sp. OT10]|uniref:MFS transporter n=1 Tax=Roseomonas cutis TaxID=2897332 RepID=UPI001E5F3A8F|nr:MFS transporter [Roseomonas sp. OT10]UFN47936.1 arabinose transporter [Roseomonas sp. OT10]